ncbi:MAG: serine/threonine-protein phosphatase, partial [Streptomyces sp.]|nr:serine/threonine-protein phosphatase [Streptomyces sp.]
MAGSEPRQPAATHTPGAPVATAPSPAAVAGASATTAPGVPAAASAPAEESAGDRPHHGPPGPSPSVQDRLASWVCDLSLLHELTERLARTALLDDTLREVVQAGGTLVGARRGLITVAPADGPGPAATVGLGLGHAELGALETVGFGTVPAGSEEAAHPDLRHGPGAHGRHVEVAAQLGLGAAYGLALAVDAPRYGPCDATVSSPDSANPSTSGITHSAGTGGSTALLCDRTAEDFRDFSTTGSTPSAASVLPPSAARADSAPGAVGFPTTGPAPSAAPAATTASGAATATPARHRLGAVVWFYDEAAEPTARQRRLTGMYLRFAAQHIARGLDLARARTAAADLSAEMLPARLPRVPGVRMAVRHGCGPRGGGDWYDALPLPEGALGR